MSLSEEKKQALDVLMARADGEYKSNKELLCDSCYRKIAGCQAKFHNPHPVDHCIEYKPIEKQADGEYIRRSDVIKAVDKHTIDTSEIVLDEDITVILEELPSVAIPSAEPKTCKCRKAHEMIEDRVHCSCGLEMIITGHWDEYNFCPRCGAKMD